MSNYIPKFVQNIVKANKIFSSAGIGPIS